MQVQIHSSHGQSVLAISRRRLDGNRSLFQDYVYPRFLARLNPRGNPQNFGSFSVPGDSRFSARKSEREKPRRRCGDGANTDEPLTYDAGTMCECWSCLNCAIFAMCLERAQLCLPQLEVRSTSECFVHLVAITPPRAPS